MNLLYVSLIILQEEGDQEDIEDEESEEDAFERMKMDLSEYYETEVTRLQVHFYLILLLSTISFFGLGHGGRP